MQTTLFVLAALATLAVFVYSDTVCDNQDNQYECDSSNQADGPCHWCVSRAVPSFCANNSDYGQLPPAVFICDRVCEAQQTEAACSSASESSQACMWCTANGYYGVSLCMNATNYKLMPSKIFTCKSSRDM